MSNTKSLVKILAISLLLINQTFAEDPKNELQYIEKKDNSYIFHTTMKAPSVFDTNLFYNEKDSLATGRALRGWFLDIKNIDKAWWKLSIETKISSTNDMWVTELKSIMTNALNFRNPDQIYFIKNWEIIYKNYGAVVILKLNKDLSKIVNQWILGTKEFKLEINWVEVPLVPDDALRSDDAKCYIISSWIHCASSIFPSAENNVRLKIDWFYSNSIYINKETYSFERLIKSEIEDSSWTKYIKFTFDKPKDVLNLNNVDVYVNWSKIPAPDYSLWLNQVSFRYDLMKLTKDDKFIKVVFKNNTDNSYSKPVFLNIENQIWMNIKKTTVSRVWSSELTFECTWDIIWMIGNNYKFKINMNWTDYFLDWVKEAVMENWKEKIDKYWHVVYVQKNKLSLIRRTNTALIFGFDENLLVNGENVFYVKNDNTNRESNKVSFTKWKYENMNHVYSTWTVAPSYDENIEFENWKDIIQKKIDFVNQKDNNVTFWKLSISNLKDYNVYKLSFDIASNATMNPFSQLRLGNIDLQIRNLDDWSMKYRYELTWIWKELVSWDLVWTINELFNVNTSVINMKLTDFRIEKLDTASNWVKIFNSNAFSEINFSYDYDFWNCFDWDKDYCSLNWLKDPALTVNLLFWKNQPNTSESSSNIVPIIAQNNKVNIEIVEMNFRSDKYKSTNIKLKRLYDLIIAKGVTSRQKTSLKNSINSIIKALKDVEDNKSKIAAAKQIKDGVSNINWILRSLKR
ncbi:MAG: hypothetical protein ACD_3C00188G0006 [uncultured bacterium (gcode 4)]|uniref:Uncharacterized protein n=1 Tax=uncultured bacterium (gcode 4) TaxID=1234023 RepID=K2GW84_9BACT|nr:MAG: hypothetical protein ACD_3C00188G0006 [uncultured bacterium (gcode 4)]